MQANGPCCHTRRPCRTALVTDIYICFSTMAAIPASRKPHIKGKKDDTETLVTGATNQNRIVKTPYNYQPFDMQHFSCEKRTYVGNFVLLELGCCVECTQVSWNIGVLGGVHAGI